MSLSQVYPGFKVLIKELQSLGLNVKVLAKREVELKDDEDDPRWRRN